MSLPTAQLCQNCHFQKDIKEENTMAVKDGTEANDVIDLRGWSAPVSPETAHGSSGLGGNDTIYGSAYYDLLQGGNGDDFLYGFNGDDGLIGQNGNDTLYGGNGDDFLSGGAGNDRLYGNAGADTLWGKDGNDHYYHGSGDGVDTINDDLSEAGNSGYGGGNDALHLTAFKLADLVYYNIDNDLYLLTAADAADNYINDGVIIEDFFLGGNNIVETLYTNNDTEMFNLTSLLA
ncbi:calcium-binding protein [Agrobacterium vitis]|nr:calcium-binding protein [Agrobacterium vitis]MUO72713.1 hypothetical protein [Agrobacterium vitis]MVA35985.1 hypothetical protein [Agrobacterium vitis]